MDLEDVIEPVEGGAETPLDKNTQEDLDFLAEREKVSQATPTIASNGRTANQPQILNRKLEVIITLIDH